MSVISCALATMTGKDSTDFKRNEKARKAVLLVETNTPLDGPTSVIRGAQSYTPVLPDECRCPRLAQGWSWGNDLDPFCLLQSIDASLLASDRDKQCWQLSLDYSIPEDDEKQDRDKHPLARAAIIERSIQFYKEVVRKDASDPPVAIKNAAGDVLPLEMDKPIAVWKITKNVATYSDALSLQYSGVVNSDEFMGAAPKQALMVFLVGNFRTEEWEETEVEFFELTAEVHFKITEKGWTEEVLQAGPRFIDADGKLSEATDDNQSYSREPVLLNNDGTKRVTGADPLYFDVERFPSKSFGALGLL